MNGKQRTLSTCQLVSIQKECLCERDVSKCAYRILFNFDSSSSIYVPKHLRLGFLYKQSTIQAVEFSRPFISNTDMKKCIYSKKKNHSKFR